MGVARHGWLKGALAAVAALAVVGTVSGDTPGTTAPVDRNALVGQYRHSTVFAAGQSRRSVATIAARGAGFSIAWEEDDGNLFGGVGIVLDGVLGAAYTEALNGSFRGKGVLAYRISGGTLDGVRLPSDAPEGVLIQETLEGSPALEGRYAIARSLDADGRAYHAGYVEIVRHGDTYQMTWFTPARSYDPTSAPSSSTRSSTKPALIAISAAFTLGGADTTPSAIARSTGSGSARASTSTPASIAWRTPLVASRRSIDRPHSRHIWPSDSYERTR